MMKNNKHFFTRLSAVFLILVMTVTAAPLNGFSAIAPRLYANAQGEAVKTGDCGKEGSDVTFSLYADGTLEISGSGEMEDYKFYKYPPYTKFNVNKDDDSWYGNDEDAEDLFDGSRGFDKTVKKVVINSGVTAIGDFAFASLRNLTEISIPDTVSSIGRCAFYNCKNLTDIVIPDTVGEIKDSTFLFSGLKHITLGNSIQKIGQTAFYCCNLTEVSIPDSVTQIDMDAFSDCEYLEKIELSGNLVRLGENAFTNTAYYYNDKNWTDGVLYVGSALAGTDPYAHTKKWEYEIKKGTTCIADWAFYACTTLTKVSIPDTVKEVPDKAFKCCYALESVVLPAKLQTIGKSAFQECSKLSTVSFPSSLSKVGELAFADTAMTSVTVPSRVKTIEDKAFGFRVKDPDDEFNIEYVKVKNFTVKGKSGSAAEKYAKNSGLRFVAADTHTHSVKSPKITKATFTKNGLSTGVCSGCKQTVKTVIYKVSTVRLSASKYIYNGKVRTPSVTVKDSKGNTLKKNTDYTVSYAPGRKNPGKYTVKITLRGKYSGNKTLYYSIVPGTPTLQASAGSGRAYLKWNKQAGATGYVVYYSTSKNGKYNRISATKGTSFTVLKLTRGRTYYFKVVAYTTVGGQNIYGSNSAAKSVKAK